MHLYKLAISGSQREIHKSPLFKHGMQFWNEAIEVVIPFQTEIDFRHLKRIERANSY